MKLRDNKRTRNYRLWREMDAARDRRENLIGVDTGFSDKFGNAIRTGDYVLIDGNPARSIVLFSKNDDCYCVMRGCWYGERNPFDPRSYGKVDYLFLGKPRKLTDIVRRDLRDRRTART